MLVYTACRSCVFSGLLCTWCNYKYQIHCCVNLRGMTIVVSSTTRTLILGPPLTDVYTPYVRLQLAGCRMGGSQATVIEVSVLSTIERFLGGEGGTVVDVFVLVMAISMTLDAYMH